MKKSDRKRIEQDKQIDIALESDVGKEKLRADFKENAANSSLIALLETTLELDGNIIECGVYRGASLWMIGQVLHEKSVNKQIFALDSFEGFPEEQVTENDTSLFRSRSRLQNKFRHAKDVPERVANVFDMLGVTCKTLVGYFDKTLPLLKDETYCFAHIDSDTYMSHIECLNAVYDKVVPGGVIVFDDYHDPAWPGATKAVDEFFADKLEKVELDSSRTEQAWFARKV